MERATNYNSSIVDSFAPYIGGTVLEVGIGHGNFAKLLARYADNYIGVDIDPVLVEHAQAANPANSYIVADITSSDLIPATASLGIDTVLACNILEHVAEDGLAVHQLLRVLPKGGHLLLYVPAFVALYNAMDRLAGHYRRYTRGTLAALVPADLGHLVRLDYVNPIGGLGWWVNGLLRPKLSDLDQVNGQIALFDRYIQPISQRLSPLFSRVFGQSISCVIRRC